MTASGGRRYLFNTAWLLGEQLFRLLAGLLVGLYVARYLGPYRYGLFNYAMSFSGLFWAIATLGMDSIVVREIVRRPEDEESIVGTAFVLKIAGSCLAIVSMLLCARLVSDDHLANHLIFIMSLSFVFQALSVVDSFFQAKVMVKYVVRIQLVQIAISSAVKVWLVVLQAPVSAFVWVIAGESFFLYLGLLIVHRWLGHRFPLRFHPALGLRLLKDSLPQILASIIVTMYMRLDQVMLKFMRGEVEVGYFAAAVRVSEIWHFIPTVICKSVFPAVMNAKLSNEDEYYNRLGKLYDMTSALAIGVVLPLSFLSDFIIVTLFGQSFAPAGTILAIHIWSSIFIYLSVASHQWFMAENLLVLVFFRAFMGGVVNVVLNLVLIPKYGAIGAAMASLVSFGVSAMSCCLLFKWKRHNLLLIKALFPFFRLKGDILWTIGLLRKKGQSSGEQ